MRSKAATRQATRDLIARGEMVRRPCIWCSAAKAEAHHPDYGDPRRVWWLCKRCHVAIHYGVTTTDLRANLRDSLYVAWAGVPGFTEKIGAPPGSVADFINGGPLTFAVARALVKWGRGYLGPVLAELLAGGRECLAEPSTADVAAS